MNEKILCPYNIGDIVRFTPSQRTKGLYQAIEDFGIKIGEAIEICRISNGIYIYGPNDVGGWPWNEFELVSRASK